ncbi:hypothetical protein V8F20_001265 [Naviculisporaceae sp. PSN 640]
MAGVALLGAGIFAKEQHLPAILAAEKSGLGQLKAIYSRSQASAEGLIRDENLDAKGVEAYFDSPETEGKGLNDLLKRSDIHAVIIALPILNQPSVIRQALKAGKHVLSEKPIAQDMEAAEALLDFYKIEICGDSDAVTDKKRAPIWGVAENFRFYPSLQFAAEQIAALGGKLRTFKLEMYSFIKEDNKYYLTEWRKTPGYMGGFLLDGGVHFIAALRALLKASGSSLTKALAHNSLLQENLAPSDTVHAVVLTETQIAGTITISFATEFKSGLSVEVTTENGNVVWTPGDVRVQGIKDGEKYEKVTEFEKTTGVKEEVRAFLEAVQKNDGTCDDRLSPYEARGDLNIIQMLLRSE